MAMSPVVMVRSLFLIVSTLLFASSLKADQVIYDDALVNGWEAWGWATSINYNSTAYVHGGTKAISVTGAGWEAMYWHHSAFNSSSYTNLTFWINGGASGGQLLLVQAQLNGAPQTAYNLPPLLANTWQEITIPLSALGAANKSNLDGFWIQDRSNASFPTFHVDDVRLVSTTNTTGNTATTSVTIDAAQNRLNIDPNIYGVAFASSNELADMNVPLNRSGGNATTRYNWQQNSWQTGFDWFFQSLPHAVATPGDEADKFIASSWDGGAEPMITVPMMGWVADVTASRIKRWSFSIAKYGTQTDNESAATGGQPWAIADAGNGIRPGGQYVTNNDPLDANMPVTSAFQTGWLQHLTNRWGTASNSGVRYYMLDNEPSLWHSTHRDVFRTGATMEMMRNRTIEYASLIKSIDPDAVIFGPEEWGWSGYLYSGYDQQYSSTNGWGVFPDKAAHGGWDFMPWLLNQLRLTNVATGKRLLDVFTLHYYPQGGEFSSDVSTDMQLRRNRSTRSLWDTNYVDESWIGTSVHLIPRMKWWVQTNYPGTKIGLTEYSWGADTNINGATAQADILGILGREGMDYATRWVSPATNTPAYNAIKMYRNYDGVKSTFGSLSVFSPAPTPDEVATFAALRTNDWALTVMAINKAFQTNALQLQLTNFMTASNATVWQLNSSNVIRRLTSTTNFTTQLNYTLPAQSITLFVIPQRIPARPTLSAQPINAPNELTLALGGDVGFNYVIQSSSNLLAWTPIRTNLLMTVSTNIVVPRSASAQFYRAIWQP
jgi:hypothetical protein